MFDLTLASNLVPYWSLTTEQALVKSHSYKLIWTGGLDYTTLGDGPSDINPSINIKDCLYICLKEHSVQH